MENLDWLLTQIADLETEQATFATKSLLLETQKVAKKQARRIEQAQAELDGRIWSPNKW